MENKKSKRCVIVSGAPLTDNEVQYLKHEISSNDFVICADCGYDKCRKAQITPNMFVGDADSVNIKPVNTECIILPNEKDDTDTFFAVRKGIELGFKDFLILGAIGGDIDHSLCNLSCLIFLAKRGFVSCIKTPTYTIIPILGREYLVPQCSRITICNKKGKMISVLTNEKESKIIYTGLKYNLKNNLLNFEYQYGIRNKIESDKAEISVVSGSAFVVVYN